MSRPCQAHLMQPSSLARRDVLQSGKGIKNAVSPSLRIIVSDRTERAFLLSGIRNNRQFIPLSNLRYQFGKFAELLLSAVTGNENWQRKKGQRIPARCPSLIVFNCVRRTAYSAGGRPPRPPPGGPNPRPPKKSRMVNSKAAPFIPSSAIFCSSVSTAIAASVDFF